MPLVELLLVCAMPPAPWSLVELLCAMHHVPWCPRNASDHMYIVPPALAPS